MHRNRKWFLILILALLMPALRANAAEPAPASVKLTDEELGDLLQRAVTLAQFGFYAEAEESCKRILEQKPDQPTVKQLLQEIQQKRRLAGGDKANAGLQRKLTEIILPEVNFREAVAHDVFAYLQDESKRLSADKTAINIVWMVPDDSKQRLVTLALQKVPMLDVIRYVTDLTGLRFRIDPHAIVIYQPESPAPAPSSSAESHVRPE